MVKHFVFVTHKQVQADKRHAPYLGTVYTAKPRKRFIKIYFHNKGIDKVNLTNILHNKLVKSKVPVYFQEQDPPLVSYKYTNTISRSVFNYNETLRNIHNDTYSAASSSCDCASSTFRYDPHGHVITGDLHIVQNRKLRRLRGTQRQFSEKYLFGRRFEI